MSLNLSTHISSFRFHLLLGAAFLLCSLSLFSVGMARLGGVKVTAGAQNSVEIEQLARFAVAEHNKKENAILEFSRVVKAKEQVVAGMLHYLTVEVTEAGKKKFYEAKVWVKPWLQFKDLLEFNQVGESASFTAADLGVCRTR